MPRTSTTRLAIAVLAAAALFPASAAAAQRLDDARLVPLRLAGSLQNPCWSPDGSRLAITQWQGGYNETPAYVVRVRASGGGTLNRISRPGDNAVNMPGSCWNPASDRIAFTADPVGPDQVYTADPDGQNRFQVTHLVGFQAFEPTISPDGRWIVFERHKLDVEGGGQIWKVRADGTRLSRLTSGADDRQPNWAPAGNRIVFQRKRGRQFDLVTIRPDGSELRNITRTPGLEETDVSWSPSGRWLVFSSDGANVDIASLFTIRFDGQRRQRLTRTRDIYDGAPGWSPSGRKIAFESRRGDPDGSPGTKIWVIAAPAGRR
jgi:TolB protein